MTLTTLFIFKKNYLYCSISGIVNCYLWYSYKTKTWYFLTDPEGKHSQLMVRIHNQMRNESIRQFQDQLKVLQTRYRIEQQKIAEHRAAMKNIEAEMEQLVAYINKTKAGVPVETEKPLEYSTVIRR